MDDDHDVCQSDGRAFRLGDWLADAASCRLTRGDEQHTLEPKVMELLELLVEREGRVVSKAEILERVWSGGFVVESVLTRAVSLIRKALGDSARDPMFIETIPRRGYRVIAPVRRLEPPAAADGRPPPTTSSSVSTWTLQSDTGSVKLPQGETVIGRGDDADLVLDSVDVSRHHARVTVAGQSAVVEDLGSKNGTLLNGRLLAGPTPLGHLDVVVLSSMRLLVRKGSSEVETETATP